MRSSTRFAVTNFSNQTPAQLKPEPGARRNKLAGTSNKSSYGRLTLESLALAKLTSYLVFLVSICLLVSGIFFLAALTGRTIVLSSSTDTFTNGTITEFTNGSRTTITNALVTDVRTASLATGAFLIWGGLLLTIGLVILTLEISLRIGQEGRSSGDALAIDGCIGARGGIRTHERLNERISPCVAVGPGATSDLEYRRRIGSAAFDQA